MTSTFINLPPPPSDPVTPSEVPGTPNSGTTSLSALSTVAIKDGHQGHSQHSHHYHHTDRPTSNSSNASTTTLDAERADRISRLAGLERVSTLRQSGSSSSQNTSAGGPAAPQQLTHQPIGYFDATGNPVLAKERSTVGSASATGSMGGRTTWASGSDVYDADKMSEDNTDALSQGGLSDDANASLVGFGEGANSVIDGPISGAPAPAPVAQTARFVAQQQAAQSGQGRWRGEGEAMQGVSAEQQRVRNIDGMTYDRDTVDSAVRNSNPIPPAPGSAQGTPAPRHAGLSGRETTERIVQERYGKRDQDIDMGGNE